MKATLIGLVLLGATVVAAPTWRVEKGDVRVICSMRSAAASMRRPLPSAGW